MHSFLTLELLMAFSTSSVSFFFQTTAKSTNFLKNRKGIFEDDEIVHVDGSVDPVRDLETINEELMLKDLDQARKLKEAVDAVLKRQSKDKAKKDEQVSTHFLLFRIAQLN